MQESEVQKWIEAVLNEPFPDGKAYEDVLKDGVILCKLMNTLSPGSIPKINISGANFKLMENVSRYVCMYHNGQCPIDKRHPLVCGKF